MRGLVFVLCALALLLAPTAAWSSVSGIAYLIVYGGGPWIAGQPQTVQIYQEVQEQGQHVASIQFSGGPANPGDPPDQWQWVTSRPIDGGGILEFDPVPYQAGVVNWWVPGLLPTANAYLYLRLGVWESSAGVDGSPVFTSLPDSVRVLQFGAAKSPN